MEDFEKFYLIAVNFLSYRTRSEKEIRDKLKSKNAPEDIINKVVEQLIQQRFINDEQFAHDWVRSRTTYRLKSKRIIKIELLKKGIDPEIIDKALKGEIDDDEKEVSDLDQAKKLASGRIGRYKNLPKQEIYRKLGGYLGRRGFNWETIKAAIDDALKLGYNE